MLALVGLVSAAGIAFAASRRTPEYTLVWFASDSATGRLQARSVGFGTEDFSSGGPLHASRGVPATLNLPDSLPPMAALGGAPPAGFRWPLTMTAPDSGGEDVFLIRRDGVLRRLTRTPGDDAAAIIAPDGRTMAFSTDRFSNRSRSSVVLLSFADSSLRRLTTSSTSRDYPVRWSPDGLRILFGRHTFAGHQSDSLCVAQLTGASHCVSSAGLTGVGWLDDSHALAIGSDQEGERRLFRLNLQTGAAVTLQRASSATVSSDGRYVFCQCERRGSADLVPQLFPAADPDRARPIAGYDGGLNNIAIWSRADREPPHPAHLAIAMTDTAAFDGPFHLRLLATDQGGISIGAPPVVWRSSDTATATVDDSGVMKPRHPGRVTISATAVNGLETSRVVPILPAADTTLFREDWSHGITPRWVLFGVPQPRLAGWSGRRELLVNGDSTFPSGVWLARALANGSGLGVEFRASTPMTAAQWQYISVDVLEGVNWSVLRNWDRVTGSPSFGGSGCSLEMGTEGTHADQGISVGRGQEVRLVRLDHSFRSGRWWTGRIQLFPDGRCGIAIDGKPVWMSRSSTEGASPYLLMFSGQSYHTRIAVSTVAVWHGVRHDVDWALLDTTAAASR